jgi:hypothetical protein
MNPGLAAALLFFALAAAGSVEGAWKPASTSSVSITGPIVLAPRRLTVTGAEFPLGLVAQVPAFHSDQGDRPARIFAVTAPTNPPLLNGNRLCGDAPVTWMVVQPIPPGRLEIAAFTGRRRPTGEDSPDLCGTFFYYR